MPGIFVLIFIGILVGSCAAESDHPLAFWLYYGSNYEDHNIYEVREPLDLLKDLHFDPNLPTVIYAFGWTENPQSGSTRTIINSYIERGDWNVILLDWQTLARPFYPIAARNVRQVGEITAAALVDLIAAGLNIDTLHLVGHSLGSHVAGHIGRNVIWFSKGVLTIPRISGLDPAGPLWSLVNSPLSKSDAKFVDIIHTDTTRLGTSYSYGSVAFWPNGGAAHPGCPLPIPLNNNCNHHMSWRFWSESVWSPDQNSSFLAVRAPSWSEFKKGNIDRSVTIQMGINTPTNSTGDWFLQTNAQRPHSRSTAGITFLFDF